MRKTYSTVNNEVLPGAFNLKKVRLLPRDNSNSKRQVDHVSCVNLLFFGVFINAKCIMSNANSAVKVQIAFT